ncbi:MAG TPA: type III-A CRISPR-associated protein Csm2 [Ignavibacteria bacterium]|nr:type III-A CRISPR-associated protein Csm2 [Ignavibacteria bacterium]HMR40306.1 type III-A CRISPR-associated protein Csm2 [Ignavibacteria bacterium]
MSNNFLINQLIDENGNIIFSLINNMGENNVEDLANFLSKDIGNKNDKPISKNQLRKFYDSFLKIYFNKSKSEEKKIQLLLLKAQAEYSSKGTPKIKRFKDIFENRVNIIISKNDDEFKNNLNAFKLHFEALVGYFPEKKIKK